MATRSEANAGYVGRSLHGQTQAASGQNLDLIRDIYRYQILYERVVYQMRKYTNLYTNGKYVELKEMFTESEYDSIISSNKTDNYYSIEIDELINFTYDSGTFGQYRSNMYSILTGLKMAMNQNEKLLTCETNLKEKNTLLNDKDLLLEYFKKQFRDRMSMDAFFISQSYNIDVVLKPWYSLYLTLYGAPYDGVFDAEKMGLVVEQLINEGTITMQEFIDG
jgi:hypothetical protein